MTILALIQAGDHCGDALNQVTTVGWYDVNASRFIEDNDDTDHSSDYQWALSFVKNTKPKVLDIGCAQGRDMTAFSKLGAESVVGIEPSKPLAEHAASRANSLVINKTLEEINLDKDLDRGSFDLVWAMASLLHIRSDGQVAALEKIAQLLSTDGILLATYKVGDGDRIDTRGKHKLLYFDTNELEFRKLIDQVPSLEIERLEIQEDYNRPGLQWLRAAVRKI